MNPSAPPLDIKVGLRGDLLCAGEELPVTFLLKRPETYRSSVQVRLFHCSDPNVLLNNTDRLQQGIEIRPGELYRVTLGLTVKQACTLDLSSFHIEYRAPEIGHSERISPRSRPLTCRPSLRKEIEVSFTPLYTYQRHTKVLVSLFHRGTTRFKDFSASIEPDNSLVVGKHLYLPLFAPGHKEEFEWVLEPGGVDLVLSARFEDTPVIAQFPYYVPLLEQQSRKEPFHFLEPRRLSRDHVAIYAEHDSGGTPLTLHRGEFVLQGGASYDIHITPQSKESTQVDLRGVPQTLVVRSARRGQGAEPWKFHVDVTADEVLTKPERLFYDVKTPEGEFAGEIHVAIKPSRFRHLKFAAIAGATLTLQGAYGALTLIRDPEFFTKHLFSKLFTLTDWQASPLLMLSIPVIWLLLWLIDFLQFRLCRR